ncbi:MAG: zinc ribbon domain-containing protein [Chloroflexota bacterium]|jgi:membrane protease subunit (stomatin/prohibitin family)|nr:zinc ribbon domain-containing protein [Chloroflexota bacterium]
MDTLLIFIIFALVIGIGFILSRPFVRMEDSQEDLSLNAPNSSSVDAAKSVEKAAQLNTTDFCPKCGHRVTAKDKFCTHCGNRL